MKFFSAFRIFVVVMLLLATSSVLISFLFPSEKSEAQESKKINAIEQTINEVWYPIPVSEIEIQEHDSESKYWVVLENGFGFYTDEKIEIGEPGAWVNDEDSIIFHKSQKN